MGSSLAVSALLEKLQHLHLGRWHRPNLPTANLDQQRQIRFFDWDVTRIHDLGEPGCRDRAYACRSNLQAKAPTTRVFPNDPRCNSNRSVFLFFSCGRTGASIKREVVTKSIEQMKLSSVKSSAISSKGKPSGGTGQDLARGTTPPAPEKRKNPELPDQKVKDSVPVSSSGKCGSGHII